MIFLIEYSRGTGELIQLIPYADADRDVAAKMRLDLEVDLLCKKVQHEVVLLEAKSEDALKKTHERYFRNFKELAESGGDAFTASRSQPRKSGQ